MGEASTCHIYHVTSHDEYYNLDDIFSLLNSILPVCIDFATVIKFCLKLNIVLETASSSILHVVI